MFAHTTAIPTLHDFIIFNHSRLGHVHGTEIFEYVIDEDRFVQVNSATTNSVDSTFLAVFN